MAFFSSVLNIPSFLILLFASFISSFVFAHQHENHKHDDAMVQNTDIMVMDGYARATFAMAKTGAVYFTLHNQKSSDVKLTAVQVDPAVANEAQIHTTEMNGDVMKMREMTEGVMVTGNDMVSFKPGGYHIMLLGLSKGLEVGNEIELTLIFDDNRELKVLLPVKKDGNTGHHHHH